MHRLALLALLAACGNKSKLDASHEADALWALAPDRTELAIVMGPHGLDLALRGIAAFAELGKTPDFSARKVGIDAVVTALLGAPGARPADVGIAPERGLAIFVVDAGRLAALPVVDRDKWLAANGGTRGKDADFVNGNICKPLRGSYVCASSEALLDRLGKGDLRGKAALAGGRGDVELYAPAVALLGGTGDIAITATLEPGAIAARGKWIGPPPAALARLAGAVAPKIDPANASGFATLNIAPLLGDAPDTLLVAEVTLAQLAKSLAGPISVVIPAGSVDLQIHVPLVDPAPARGLVEHCNELPGLETSPGMPEGECWFQLRGASLLQLQAWVDGKELRIGSDRLKTTPGKPGALTAIGKELAAGTWTASVWGRGTLLNLTGVAPASGELPPVAALMVHAISLVDELGAAIAVDKDSASFRVYLRTAWANPPNVVSQLLAISGDDVASGRATARGKAIADAAPDSPFAADFAAGQGGMMVPAAMIGIVASELVPMLQETEQPPGPRPIDKAQLVQVLVRAYVVEAYPEWQKANPGKTCPASLAELAGFLGAPPDVPTMVDPWDHPLVLLCGKDLPAGAQGIAVMSAGPDGKPGTADDVKSW